MEWTVGGPFINYMLQATIHDMMLEGNLLCAINVVESTIVLPLLNRPSAHSNVVPFN